MSEKLKFGVIGYGFMGKTHVGNIRRHPRAELVAVYSQPEIKVDLENITVYTEDWKKLIDDSNVQAVVIATPTTTHREIAIYAAKAKKHIFLEKPMARTVEECADIIKAAEENNVKLFVAHVLRFWPSYAAAFNSITEKDSAIGDVKMVRAQRFSAFPQWSPWFASEKESGGCILDLSIHDIDFAQWILGKPIDTVYCEARKLPEMGIDNWGISMTTLHCATGEIAHCEASWAATPAYGFGTACEVIGTEGIIKFDSRSSIPIRNYGKDTTLIDDPMVDDGYYLELDAFVHSVLDGAQILVSGKNGKYAVALCIAALKSAHEHRPVKVSEVL